MPEKLDLKQEYKALYAPPQKPVLVDVPAFNFLCLDGRGDPNHSDEFSQAIATLFTFSFTLKFAVKKARGVDYAVMPLEGLWWVEDLVQLDFDDKSNWLWTLMMHQPGLVTPADVQAARPAAAKKAGADWVERVRFEAYHEGPCVQMMHVGPFAAEQPNIQRMHAYARGQGCQLHRKHHEIYLSDFRRAAPEKLRTVLRQPVICPPGAIQQAG